MDLTKAARRYAQDANFAAGGENLFGGNPEPESSFEEAFGSGSRLPAAEMARTPELSAEPGERFQPGASTRYHIARARFRPHALDEEDADVTPHSDVHAANVHLMELLGRASGRPLDDAALHTGAFHFSPEQLPALRRSINDQAAAHRAADTSAITDLDRTIQDAQKNGRSLTFVRADESLPSETRQTLLAQELNHVRQRLLAPVHEYLGSRAASFVRSPLGAKAKAALERSPAGYSFGKNDHLAAFEIGERLMRPGGYRELGLSGAERDVLAHEYVRSLKEEYGDRAKAVIERVRKSRISGTGS